MPDYVATIETNHGTIKIEFYPEDAPKAVENFVKLAKDGYYDGLIFHRIIKGFMMQGGCPDGTGMGGPGYNIPDEFNDRTHKLGTVSMARTNAPDSAGSQFFICFKEAPHLDRSYTLFGKVIDGIEVVENLEKNVETGPNDRPVKDVKMSKVTITEK